MKQFAIKFVRKETYNLLNNNKLIFKNLFRCNSKCINLSKQPAQSISLDGEFVNGFFNRKNVISAHDIEMF